MKDVLLNLPMRSFTLPIRDALFRPFSKFRLISSSFFSLYNMLLASNKKKTFLSVKMLPLVLLIRSLRDLRIIVFGFYLHLTQHPNLFGNRVVV